MSTAAQQSYTFLFTDIEGSSRLWNHAPAAMTMAVQQQEAILRQAIGSLGGTVFKSVGDGVYAVFPHAPQAVRAAVDGQRALLSHSWEGFETPHPIRVRIAIHSGPAEFRDGDYFGPTLNRLSRTLAAGHGGQILCTDDALAACGEAWPDGIQVRDLGERALRDVPGNGRIYQLIAEGLPEHFPPLATLDLRVHNLPRWSSPTVGRETEASRLRSALRAPDIRLVTVLGTGGVGKTRLTAEVASQLLDEFQHGIRFVDLSPLRDDEQVIPAILQATGASDHLLAPNDAVLDWLRDRELLLVLDNCEQVIEGVAAICSGIAQAAPHVRVLASSRLPIRIRGERQIALEPLPVAGDPASSPAVSLFVERAQEVSTSFALDQDNAEDVAQICRQLDGLPLAIELAAPWVRVLSPSALQRRLQENRAILRDGARDLPDRHRTLTNTIAWSYDLLAPDDQRAFRRLAVFRGGIAVDAAEAVLREGPESDPLWTLSRLDALVQANLLQVSPDATGEPRFLMLQTIQEFAVGVLREADEWDDASHQHAEFFAGLTSEAEAHSRAEDTALWLDRLDRELENLRTAVDFYAGLPGVSQRGLEMVVELWGFLDHRGHELEARSWLTMLFRDDPAISAQLRARANLLLGNSWLSNYDQAEKFYLLARAAAREADDEQLQLAIVASLGSVALLKGEYGSAIATIESIVDSARRSGDADRLGYALIQLAHSYSEAGQYGHALDVIAEAEMLLSDPAGTAWLDLTRGRVLRRYGHVKHALECFERARSGFSAINARFAEASCLYEAGAALIDREREASVRCIATANDYLLENTRPFAAVTALEVNAALLAAEGAFDDAARIAAAAQTWRITTGTPCSRHDQRECDELFERIRLAIGEARFEACLDEGRLLSLRTAIEIVHRLVTDRAATPSSGSTYLVQQKIHPQPPG